MTWTVRSTPSDGATGQAACVGASGRVVACGYGPASCLIYSDDGGETWLQSDPNALDGQNATGVIWADYLSLYVAVGKGLAFAIILTSPDGITWTTQVGHPWVATASTLLGIGVDEDNGLLIASGRRISNDFDYLSSVDGVTWTQGDTGISIGYAVKWLSDLSLWVLVGSPAVGQEAIQTSPDATTWTGVPSGFDTGRARCVGQLVSGDILVGGIGIIGGESLVQSSDAGASFVARVTPFDGGGETQGIAVGADIVYLGGYDTTSSRVLATSADDGATYAFETHPFDSSGGGGWLFGFALSASLWVSVGSNADVDEMVATTDAAPPLQPTQYQRIYGFRVNISDDALETLDPVLTSPQDGTNA